MATITMNAAARAISGSVTGRRLTMRRPTGTSYWMDTPRSPRRARPEPGGILHGQRTVQAERLAEPGDGFGAALGADDQLGGVTRQHADHDEDEDRDEEERGDERRSAPYQVLPHGSGTRYGAGAHDTSERSPEGVGRSCQSPCSPFRATARRGCI